MINDRAKEMEEAAHDSRRLAIAQLSLWGWEPVEYALAGPSEVRLMQRSEKLCASGDTAITWAVWPMDPTMEWAWQPCEWSRFSTGVLKQCVKRIGERDGLRQVGAGVADL